MNKTEVIVNARMFISRPTERLCKLKKSAENVEVQDLIREKIGTLILWGIIPCVFCMYTFLYIIKSCWSL